MINLKNIIQITLVFFIGFAASYYYMINNIASNHNIPYYFFSPGILIGMAIGGGPHGNTTELTIAIGCGIQLVIMIMIVKYIYFKIKNITSSSSGTTNP